MPLLSGDTWSLKKMREQSLKQVRCVILARPAIADENPDAAAAPPFRMQYFALCLLLLTCCGVDTCVCVIVQVRERATAGLVRKGEQLQNISRLPRVPL